MQLAFMILFAMLAAAEFVVILVLRKKNTSESGNDPSDMDSALLCAGGKIAAGTAIPAAVHEFRQPLTVVGGYVDLLGAKLWNNADFSSYLTASHDSLVQLSKSITELRELARPPSESGGITKLKLSDLIRESADFLHEQFEKHRIHLETSVPPDEPEIEIRKSECKLMLLCLFDNAKNALQSCVGEKMIHISITSTSNDVRVSIADNGPGMDSTVLHHCFDPFYSTTPNGAGLGLPFSGAVMRHQGGGIRINQKKKPATGCVVILTFPKKGLPYVQ